LTRQNLAASASALAVSSVSDELYEIRAPGEQMRE